MEQVIVQHGLGYVGLTGMIHACQAGYKVVGYDPDGNTVVGINQGKPRAGEYLDYIDDNVRKFTDSGQLFTTTDFNMVAGRNIHFLSVPTEKGDEPYMAIVKDSIYKLHETMPIGGLIVVESTLQPGTIDMMYLPRLLKGEIYLAVCPRLDWFADKEKNLTNLPRIVGGYNKESTDKAVEVLTPICKDIRPTNYRTAEMAKAGQNYLYHVQIMAAYQMAEMYQGHTDMNEVLRLIGVHWRLPNLYLGPGTSGRCVAMGTRYILEGTNYQYYQTLGGTALHYDTNWRYLISDVLTKPYPFPKSEATKLLVMGVAYCPNFSDFGNSAGLQIAQNLYDHAWDVSIHDPIVNEETLAKATKIPFNALSDSYDAILLATAHQQYHDLPSYHNLWKKGQFVVDATGLWEPYRKEFLEYGVTYLRVGEQNWMEKVKYL